MSKASDRLRAEVESLPDLSTDRGCASERRWHGYVNEIRRFILEDDPAQFLTWPPIVSTMAALGHQDWSSISRQFLQTLPDWNVRWKIAITEVPIGNPSLHSGLPPTSCALVTAAHCLALLEQRMHVKASEFNLVFEFGGGYGCMVRLLRELGFRGQYIDYDFPVIVALARYYLSEVGCEANFNTVLHSSVPVNSLFLSTWALSEAPISTRMEILSLVDQFQCFYVVYQPEFHEVDNDEFFASVPDMFQSWRWERWDIEHLGARALAGVKVS